MRRAISLGLICLLSISLSFSFLPSSLGQEDLRTTNKIAVQYLLQTPTLEIASETLTGPDGAERVYDSITISGLQTRIAPGEPMVPFETARILIPYGHNVEDVKVVAGNEKYLGKVSLAPGRDAVPIGFIDNCTSCHLDDNWTLKPEPTILDQGIYDSDSPYPNEAYSILGVQKKHGHNILYINLYPIKYIPKEGDAYSFGAFDVEVTTSPDDTPDMGLFRGLPEDQKEVAVIVDNPEKLATYPSDLVPMGKSLLLDGIYEYVIITNQLMKEAPGPYNFQELAKWKSSKGVPSAVVTVEEIYDAYKYTYPRDNQEAIRNFIRDAYMNNGLRYVLLGGDGDGERIGGETWDAVIPARLLWAWAYEPNPDSSWCNPLLKSIGIPSDFYYASLEGNFDANNNGIYGEPDDRVNLHANVYVGRAPVDNHREVSNFVRKTIEYESTTNADGYLTGMLMVGQYLEPLFWWTYVGDSEEGLTRMVGWRWGGEYKDRLKPLFPTGFNLLTLYDRDYSGREVGLETGWPRSALINLINDDMVHAINHIGIDILFCEGFEVMKMSYYHADALTNEKYFLGYTQAGYAGAFDNRDPLGFYLPIDSVLEHFVTSPGGAFAFIGSSRFGLIDVKNVDKSPSQKFDNAFWKEMFDENKWKDYGAPVTNIGFINQLSKENFIGRVIDGEHNMRYLYYSINLLGCPETPFIIPSGVLTPKVEDTAPAVPDSPMVAEAEGGKKIDPDRAVPDFFGEEMKLEFELEFPKLEFRYPFNL